MAGSSGMNINNLLSDWTSAVVCVVPGGKDGFDDGTPSELLPVTNWVMGYFFPKMFDRYFVPYIDGRVLSCTNLAGISI